MIMTIYPYVGVDGLRFGMRPEEIRKQLGTPCRIFRKSPSSPHPTDAFESPQLHIHYDVAGCCEAIEFGPDCDVRVHDIKLGGSYQSVFDSLATLDAAIQADDSGATFNTLGVGLYSNQPNSYGRVEGVIAFRPGYYD